MSLVALTQAMVAAHEEHLECRDACPVCARFGAAPIDPEQIHPGRVIAVNPPRSAKPEDW